MKSNNPSLFQVSVIIAVYNAEEFIAKAINSCLDLEEVKEIIIIDDASPDNCYEICTKLAEKDSKIKVFKHKDIQNHGAPASWNLGIKKAKCDYITILGADDFFLPNRFHKEKEVFSKYPAADGVYGAIGCHYYSKPKKANLYNEITTFKYHCKPKSFFRAFLGLKYKDFGNVSLIALTLKRKVILEYNLFLNEDLRLHQDTEYIIRLAYYLKLYPGDIINPVANRGVHQNNRITVFAVNDTTFIKNKLKFINAVLKWMDSVKTPFLFKLSKRLEKKYYGSLITGKSQFLAKQLLRIRYRLYFLYLWKRH
ncbi:glycosyltransferase family 2 protein [Flavobacteriaceae bacterium]|nr:glycosyltransferase family 2 protein [Flavobacteriaceae bacterium]